MTTLNQLTAAVTGLLAGLPNVTVFDTHPGDSLPAQAYVVIGPETGWISASRHATVADRHHWPFTALCVGKTPVQARTTAELVRGRLAGRRLVADRSVSRLFEQASGPLIRDDSTPADIRYSLTLRYQAHLERTPA